MRLLVCGGRKFDDQKYLDKLLTTLHATHNFSCIIHGGARGADELAGNWAICAGVRVEIYKADWEKYGPAAGPRRNQRMLDEAKPDKVLAFPGGAGTADMVRRARAAGVEVWNAGRKSDR